jgi:hypothetical protein
MTRLFATLGLTMLLLAGTACRPNVGERCNPLQFNVSGQCSAGLSCLYPTNCGVAFCCPPETAASTPAMCLFPPNCSGDTCCPATGTTYSADDGIANCQPCPAPDGGSTD